jgi:hypothetical protein
MAYLEDILANAQGGQGMDVIGREFGLTPEQTQAAVAALLPAISTGLKRATSTPEGVARLLAVTARQRYLRAMYDDPETAFAEPGRDAGNDILSVIFGAPAVSRAIADRAQMQSGIASSILKKLLPVLVGMLISGIFGRRSGEAAPAGAPGTTGAGGGGLWDILEQVFRRGVSGQSGSPPAEPQQGPPPGNQQPLPIPGGPFPSSRDAGGQAPSGGDFLEQILRELQKAIQDGRLKPVVIEMPMPGGQMPGGQTGSAPYETPTTGSDIPPVAKPSAAPIPGGDSLPGPRMPAPGSRMPSGPQSPGGGFLEDILRDLLGGASGAPPRMPQAGALSANAFDDRFEAGREVDQAQLDKIQSMLDQFFGSRRA